MLRPVPGPAETAQGAEVDLGIEAPPHGDLSSLAGQGVTPPTGRATVQVAGGVAPVGWQAVTERPSVRWAREQPRRRPGPGCAPPEGWPAGTTVELAHPSPLSASAGFFGRPFSCASTTCCGSRGRSPSWELPG
ncbi:hypothetical protein QJS66_09160 [Kocuria rhizophila]|nr:hypothetical protein QJS66_09160 [Kocuria rhizophila]